ncbi:MAG: hypothetical protein P1U56_26180 [Saprospiraceae bacterium]|nr:hypothetical protein [Saprospiraceae bacterium]
MNDLFISSGKLNIESDFLQIDDYPFQPSLANQQKTLYILMVVYKNQD